MKYLFLSCILLFTSLSFSQSKKKQIELLEHQLDSISEVNSELAKLNLRMDSITQRMDLENNTLRRIMKGYIYQIDTLAQINIDLEQKLDEQSSNSSNSTYRTNEIDAIKLLSRTSQPQQPPKNVFFESVEPGTMSLPEYEVEIFDESIDRRQVEFDSRDTRVPEELFFEESNDRKQVEFEKQRAPAKRFRFNDVKIDHIKGVGKLKIVFELSIDESGNVVAYDYYKSLSTTSDTVLIHKIGAEIMEQVKFVERKGAPIEYQHYRFMQDVYGNQF